MTVDECIAQAIGILFPNVQSADEAHDIIQNCYYPSAATAAAANGGGGGGADKQHVSGTRGFGYGGWVCPRRIASTHSRVACELDAMRV